MLVEVTQDLLTNRLGVNDIKNFENVCAKDQNTVLVFFDIHGRFCHEDCIIIILFMHIKAHFTYLSQHET